MSPETYAETQTQIRRLAVDAFAKHEIAVEGAGRWRCKAPGTGNYWFRITATAGGLLLQGDVGTAVFECYGPDALAVLTSADRGYLMTKMVALSRNDGGKDKFYAGDVLAFVNDWAKSHADDFEDADGEDFGEDAHLPAWVGEVRSLAKYGDLHEHEWHRIVSESSDLDVDEHSVGRNPSEGALWAVEAVRCFARLRQRLPGNAFAGLCSESGAAS
jgi:hypothetical protein